MFPPEKPPTSESTRSALLLFAPDVHIVAAPVPDPMVRTVMHGGRQRKPLQHLPTPRESQVLTQVAEDELGRAFRELLHDLGRVPQAARPDQQVGVLGHEHLADNPEAQLDPKIVQGLNEFALVALGVKDAGPSINVGGQEVEMVLTVEMLQTWHGDSLYHLAEGRRHQIQCLRHPRPLPFAKCESSCVVTEQYKHKD